MITDLLSVVISRANGYLFESEYYNYNDNLLIAYN